MLLIRGKNANNKYVFWNNHQDVLWKCGTQSTTLPAYYQEYTAKYDFVQEAFLSGNLPSKQTKIVEAWAAIHKDDLIADWQLATNGELPLPIEPLK